MKIANFFKDGVPILGVDAGEGFLNYGAILEARGIRLGLTGLDVNHYSTFLLAVGALNPDFIQTHLSWAKLTQVPYFLNLEDLVLQMPVKPGKIVCVARNWEEHAKELGNKLPDNPVIFVKTDNCAIGYGDDIEIPSDLGRVDHEGELGVVIGHIATNVSKSNASNVIHSYTIVNDVTARKFQKDLAGNKYPWFLAKSMDTFAPIGPWLVTPDEFGEVKDQRICVTVNDEIKQDGTVADMHWKPDELIEYITRRITLNPGDIVATGTPPGIGPIINGDEVVVMIEGIGELRNSVVERTDNY